MPFNRGERRGVNRSLGKAITFQVKTCHRTRRGVSAPRVVARVTRRNKRARRGFTAQARFENRRETGAAFELSRPCRDRRSGDGTEQSGMLVAELVVDIVDEHRRGARIDDRARFAPRRAKLWNHYVPSCFVRFDDGGRARLCVFRVLQRALRGRRHGARLTKCFRRRSDVCNTFCYLN